MSRGLGDVYKRQVDTQPGRCASGVVRRAAERCRDRLVRPDDQIDQRLAGDDEHQEHPTERPRYGDLARWNTTEPRFSSRRRRSRGSPRSGSSSPPPQSCGLLAEVGDAGHRRRSARTPRPIRLNPGRSRTRFTSREVPCAARGGRPASTSGCSRPHARRPSTRSSCRPHTCDRCTRYQPRTREPAPWRAWL